MSETGKSNILAFPYGESDAKTAKAMAEFATRGAETTSLSGQISASGAQSVVRILSKGIPFFPDRMHSQENHAIRFFELLQKTNYIKIVNDFDAIEPNSACIVLDEDEMVCLSAEAFVRLTEKKSGTVDYDGYDEYVIPLCNRAGIKLGLDSRMSDYESEELTNLELASFFPEKLSITQPDEYKFYESRTICAIMNDGVLDIGPEFFNEPQKASLLDALVLLYRQIQAFGIKGNEIEITHIGREFHRDQFLHKDLLSQVILDSIVRQSPILLEEKDLQKRISHYFQRCVYPNIDKEILAIEEESHE